MRLLRLVLAVALVGIAVAAPAQDFATATLRGTVNDATAAALSGATVTLTHMEAGWARTALSDGTGHYAFAMLPPARYRMTVSAHGFALYTRELVLEVGGGLELPVTMTLAARGESVSVTAETPLVETQSASVSTVIEQHAVESLPLNGRRFSDLALLAPGVTQDPRGLTSSSNGDLSFGGVRGYHSTYLVDGSDNNNAFFAQARGRYRAPYQFSNEVIQEFRVSSNTFTAEVGRTSGAVVNVVTRSGSNHVKGSAFYYLRDGKTNAKHRFATQKAPERQHQFGFTVGGPLRRNRIFYFGGFDQHIFRVPLMVRFLDGASSVTPGSRDFEASDRALVESTAQQLSAMGGTFRSKLVGNAAFFKLDTTISASHQLSMRLNASRYAGENNVFHDPASPVVNAAISENGEEMVRTESAAANLASSLSFRWNSALAVQFSRDQQRSRANSGDVRVRISGVIDSFGRSAILPRQTDEYRLHIGETVSYEGPQHSFKFGGDLNQTSIRNFFPLLFGGQYIFDDLRVNPFTFVPQTYGMAITPLRAYAHGVPRYYLQNFGDADSSPNGRELALFVQDAMRLGRRVSLSAGLRYDAQLFGTDGLVTNPAWPDSGKLPRDLNNVAPRLGMAISMGDERPVVLRAGFGVFFTRVPSIYASAVETENGLHRRNLFLDNTYFYDRALFPSFPNPLVSCPPSARTCVAPENVQGLLRSEISAFSPEFRTPSVRQASVSLEHELFDRFALGASYLFVNGRNLIRGRDVNLPQPVTLLYPVYDDAGTSFTGEFYPVQSFSAWQYGRTLDCPYPPCMEKLQRPLPNVGAINVFESAASSEYHGVTLSARRRMTRGLYFRVAYTWAHAADNGQDALVVGRPAVVENSFDTRNERGRSVTDQRHRFVMAWTADPNPFGRDRPILRALFNRWKISGVVTTGSGRPINARVNGDANRDGNSDNDRLPGARRNGFEGPDYATADLRLTRNIYLTERVRMEAMVEAFNVSNRANKRVDINDDGFLSSAAQFVAQDRRAGVTTYPGHYRKNSSFLVPNNAYAPRQLQFALRMRF